MLYNVIRHQWIEVVSWAALIGGIFLVFRETRTSGEALEAVRLTFPADPMGIFGVVCVAAAVVSIVVLHNIDRHHASR